MLVVCAFTAVAGHTGEKSALQLIGAMFVMFYSNLQMNYG